MAKELKGGYTTGACAAAGAKAALLYLQGEYCNQVNITALDGTPLTIPVKNVVEVQEGACAEVIKDAGDDPDVTNGASVFTTVKPLNSSDNDVQTVSDCQVVNHENNIYAREINSVSKASVQFKTAINIHEFSSNNIQFVAGDGIGTVTKPGLSVPVGEPAINPGPRKLIAQEISNVMGRNFRCQVIISVPGGEELAKKTLNPILGVQGGISIIGTTGVLRPMSEEAFKNSLVPQIKVAKAAGFDTQIFVPGKIGERIATQWGLPKEAMVQTSNFIGFMLEAGAELGLKRILLFGHIGKLAKVAAGVFHTHNRVGDARLETLAAYSGAAGMDSAGIQKILAANTTEDAMPIIAEYGLETVYSTIADRASYRAQRFLFNKVQVGTVMVTLQGKLLGMDEIGAEIGRNFGWNIE